MTQRAFAMKRLFAPFHKAPNTYEDFPSQDTKNLPSAEETDNKQISEKETAPSVTFPAFGFRVRVCRRVCTKHLLRLDRRRPRSTQDAHPFGLAALETYPFPLTVLLKKVAQGQLDSGSGEGQSTNRKLQSFLAERRQASNQSEWTPGMQAQDGRRGRSQKE